MTAASSQVPPATSVARSAKRSWPRATWSTAATLPRSSLTTGWCPCISTSPIAPRCSRWPSAPAAEAGPLRLWINAAGIVRVVKVGEADPEDWERIIAVNLTGTFHGCAAALAVMRRDGGGRIVNIGSLSGQVGGTGVHPAYGASKAGVHALTRTYALEGARFGIYCNAVAPSVLEGRMGGQFSERQRAQLASANPLRRLGRIEEVVGAVRYLASAAASYTNGVILPLNGGSYLA